MKPRTVLPFLWMGFVYVGTTGLAGLDPRPCCGAARALFEIRHVLTHLASFAIQVWLICLAVRLPTGGRLTRWAGLLIALGLLLGLGQETLQTLLRHNLSALDSLWDLAVDLIGSTLGWLIYTRRLPVRPVE
jgi:VanZ family protein